MSIEKPFGKGYKTADCTTSADSLYHAIATLRSMGDVAAAAHSRIGLRNMAVSWLERDFRPGWVDADDVSSRRDDEKDPEGYDIGTERRAELLPLYPRTKPKFVRDLYGEEPHDEHSFGMERAFCLLNEERRRHRKADIGWDENKPVSTPVRMWGEDGLVHWFCNQARLSTNPATLLEVEALAYCLPERRPIHVHYKRKGVVHTLKFGHALDMAKPPFHLVWSGDHIMRFQPAVPQERLEKANLSAARHKGIVKEGDEDETRWNGPQTSWRRRRAIRLKWEQRQFRKIGIRLRAFFPNNWQRKGMRFVRSVKLEDFSRNLYEDTGISWHQIHEAIFAFKESHRWKKPTATDLMETLDRSEETTEELLQQYDEDDPYLHSGF